MKTNLDEYRKKVNTLLASYELAKDSVTKERESLEVLKQEVLDLEEAVRVTQVVAQALEAKAHARIAGVVTRCLKAVFGKNAPEFLLNFERKRGKTEAQLLLAREVLPNAREPGFKKKATKVASDQQSVGEGLPKGLQRHVYRPKDGSGKGVVEVASFALRLACLVLAQPQGRRVLFLDEPFGSVWGGYRERLKELITTLSEEFNLQIIQTTHEEDLQMGKVIRL